MQSWTGRTIFIVDKVHTDRWAPTSEGRELRRQTSKRQCLMKKFTQQSLVGLRKDPANSNKDPGKIRKGLGFECVESSVLLLCALVMLKRERAGAETVVVCNVMFL